MSFLTSSLLPLPSSLNPCRSSSFLHGSLPKIPSLSSPAPPPSPPPLLVVRAMKTLQGRVVCATSDKTVAVEVVRLVAHPKYKARVRIKKKYQAHDPDNQFKVGDFVQLQKSRPISKTKTFVALPVPARNAPRPPASEPSELGGTPPDSSEQE